MMQAHQRTFDAKSKEVLRKHASLECASAYSSSPSPCYPGEFSMHGGSTPSTNAGGSDIRTTGAGLESNDYCGIGEFTDGQKWHPYQVSLTIDRIDTVSPLIPIFTHTYTVCIISFIFIW